MATDPTGKDGRFSEEKSTTPAAQPVRNRPCPEVLLLQGTSVQDSRSQSPVHKATLLPFFVGLACGFAIACMSQTAILCSSQLNPFC